MAMKIGIRAHDLAEKATPEELAQRIRSFDFHTIQLVFSKALKNPSYDTIYVQSVVKALTEKGISVALLGAYFNPVHSDPAIVTAGIDAFKANLRIAHLFPNQPPVGSETGSFHDTPWIYDPRNRTEDGYQQTKKVFRDLKDYAESIGTSMAIESAAGHVIYSYEQQARLLQELNSEHVFAIVDLFNLLTTENFAARDSIFEGALRTLGKKVRIIHIKDGALQNGELIQCAPGEGFFHYDVMASAIKRYAPNATVIFEGVKADKILTAKEVLGRYLD
jgi:L-ribulose-5-phosphate 3-epimerase